jgi:hypothetical protein
MKAWMALLVVIPACGFNSDGNNPGDGGGPPDAPPTCFGSFVTVCFTTLADVPKVPAMLPGDLTIEIDTDTGTSTTTPPLMCDQHNDQMGNYCVIAGAGFTLAANHSIRAYGTKPLVLLSTTTITLEATSTVDVSSNRNPSPQDKGAAANPSTCVDGIAAQGTGGGYGGTFGGKGGNGEQVDAQAGGNAAVAVTPPTMLRGGCRGGSGAGIGGGTGGSGGGAVALIANKIDLNGKINASGAGGLGGPMNRSGGGGGGSGGMIVLDAPSITLGPDGVVFANGGGGAEGGAGGGAGGTAAAGAPGGESPLPKVAALKGSGGDGGDGGDGSYGTTLGGTTAGGNSQHDGGGGAGGGGAGFIRARGITGDNIAPPPIELP